MTVRALPQRLPGQCLETVAVVGRLIGRRSGWCHPEQLSALRELLGAMAVAEESVVTNAVEPVRQHVDQEAADEFPTFQGHGFLAVAVSIILPGICSPRPGGGLSGSFG